MKFQFMWCQLLNCLAKPTVKGNPYTQRTFFLYKCTSLRKMVITSLSLKACVFLSHAALRANVISNNQTKLVAHIACSSIILFVTKGEKTLFGGKNYIHIWSMAIKLVSHPYYHKHIVHTYMMTSRGHLMDSRYVALISSVVCNSEVCKA